LTQRKVVVDVTEMSRVQVLETTSYVKTG